MGLTVMVGWLADGETEDFEIDVNAILRREGIPPHVENSQAAEWQADLPGYSGLHNLRRMAAWLALHGMLPPDDVRRGERSDDTVVDWYLDWDDAMADGTDSPEFAHLMLHSDCDGYYVPLDFAYPVAEDPTDPHSGYVGSSVQLQGEIKALLAAIDESPGWERERRSLGILAEACRRSLAERAAIVFI